jgi:hypothetical protein
LILRKYRKDSREVAEMKRRGTSPRSGPDMMPGVPAFIIIQDRYDENQEHSEPMVRAGTVPYNRT